MVACVYTTSVNTCPTSMAASQIITIGHLDVLEVYLNPPALYAKKNVCDDSIQCSFGRLNHNLRLRISGHSRFSVESLPPRHSASNPQMYVESVEHESCSCFVFGLLCRKIVTRWTHAYICTQYIKSRMNACLL